MGSSSQHDVLRPVWGIDVGRAGVKAVRLERAERGRIRLLGAAHATRKGRAATGDAEPALALAASFVEKHVEADDGLWVSLPAERCIHRTFAVQPEDLHAIEDIVREEIRSSVPFPPEQLTTRYHVQEDERPCRVHVVATQTEAVAAVEAAVGRPVDGIQFSNVAVFNAMVADRNLAARAKQGNRPSLVFLEMGTRETSVVVTDGRTFWSRVVAFGGRDVTRAIAEGRNCTDREAEAIKRGEKKLPPFEFVPLLKDAYLDFAGRLNQTFGVFQTSVPNSGISRVVCLGDAFETTGLVKFLEQQLRRDVGTLSKLQRVLPDGLERHPACRDRPGAFVVAYGLAVQGVGLAQLPTNVASTAVAPQGWGDRLRAWFGG